MRLDGINLLACGAVLSSMMFAGEWPVLAECPTNHLFVVGPISTAMVSGIEYTLGTELGFPVAVNRSLLASTSSAAVSPQTLLMAANRNLGDKDFGVVLIDAIEGEPARSFSFACHRTGVVVLERLCSDGEARSSERVLKRARKEALRAAGLALGLEQCPFPLCALNESTTLQELDNKGLSFCPPCIARLMNLQVEKEMLQLSK